MRYLVVGAGFSGATVARELAEAGHDVSVIDKRDHVAGNAFDLTVGNIRVHQYGPHLFHTSNERVFDYLSRFTEWVEYKHKVKAQLGDGRYVTLPVNQETKQVVGEENVLDTFFRPYTKKMWGVELEELDPSIINRVPIRDDLNEYYFPNDKYQYLPKDGYTQLVWNMLSHPRIDIELNRPFYKDVDESDFDHVFNSMPIDVYYDSIYGELPYRSIKFHHRWVAMSRVLPTATVNFTHDGEFTRVTEWKNLPGHGGDQYATLLTFEEPCDYRDNCHERYYPVKDVDGRNREIYNRYKAIENEKVTFIGRCGQYVYIDMDAAVNSALQISTRFLRKL